MPARIGPVLRSVCLLAALLVAAVVLYESTQERGTPGVLELTTNEAYLGHFAIYALMTFCTMVALAPRTFHGLAAILLFAAGLGVLLELYQAQLATRTASTGDAFADVAGAFLGLAAFVALHLFLEPPKQEQPTKY
jgi:VanZ family protein